VLSKVKGVDRNMKELDVSVALRIARHSRGAGSGCGVNPVKRLASAIVLGYLRLALRENS
jgi:hypothetical protein